MRNIREKVSPVIDHYLPMAIYERYEKLKINPKKYKVGDFVYYIKHINTSRMGIKYGRVEEHYSDGICLALVDFPDLRRVEGILIKDFPSYTNWRKLPRGWTYNTHLFEYTVSEEDNEWFNSQKDIFDITNLDNLKEMYKNGVLIDVAEKTYAKIEADYDGRNGYRLVKKPDGKHHPLTITLPYYNVYGTYQEAQDIIDKIKSSLMRISEMSDEEYFMEDMVDKINFWAKSHNISDDIREQYKEFILAQGNIEDIDVRISHGLVEWKFAKNKKFNTVELGYF